MPQIADLDAVDDFSLALTASDDLPPALVVLVSHVSGDRVQALWRHIKAGWPPVPCLVLTGDAELQSNARAAEAEEAPLKASPSQVSWRLLRDCWPRTGWTVSRTLG